MPNEYQSINGRAMSLMGELPSVRADLVAAMRAKLNDPAYDLDAEFAVAIEILCSSLARRVTIDKQEVSDGCD